MEAHEKIDQMVNRIVQHFAPEKIYLFGSHVSDRATEDSDVDLLVVMPIEGSKREQRLRLRAVLRDIRVPKDIIAVTPDELERRKDIPGTIEYPAVQEGRVVYARTQ